MQTAIPLRDIHPDAGRIISTSAAIALNGVLLMFLLVPMAPPLISEPDSDVIDFIPVRPPRRVEPPKLEKKPEKVPVLRQPQPRPTPRPAPRPRVEPPPLTTSERGDIPVPPTAGENELIVTPTTPPPLPTPADAGRPLQGAHLEYATAPAPSYPREALAEGLTGTVLLQVLVDVDGRPLEVTVSRSSGHRALDLAARRQVMSKWRFRPAMRNGQAVQAIGVVPVEFRLDG